MNALLYRTKSWSHILNNHFKCQSAAACWSDWRPWQRFGDGCREQQGRWAEYSILQSWGPPLCRSIERETSGGREWGKWWPTPRRAEGEVSFSESLSMRLKKGKRKKHLLTILPELQKPFLRVPVQVGCMFGWSQIYNTLQRHWPTSTVRHLSTPSAGGNSSFSMLFSGKTKSENAISATADKKPNTYIVVNPCDQWSDYCLGFRK